MEPETRAEWKHHPVTQELIKELRASQETLKEEWANGKYTHTDEGATIQLNAERIGQHNALQSILDFIQEE